MSEDFAKKLSGDGSFDGGSDASLPTIEGYDVIDLVGRGGMGVVYEAFQRSTGRRVAVKLMLEQVASTEAARRRFEREVELVARLHHPGIVNVIDAGRYAGRSYYVMEFVEGRSLDESFAPGACPVRAALGAMSKVARAVDYAHQRGVMHRDLKPSNIVVDERGEPRLLDFGLAKSFDPHSGVQLRASISEAGQVIGTLGYMSPEQARGAVQDVSVRSDVYALGAIAYELVVGALPCTIDGPMALVFQRIESRDPDRPSSKRREADADVDAILLKALEKDPSKRFATAGEFADDLDRWLEGRAVKSRVISMPARALRWCRRNPAVAGVLVIGMLLAISLGVAARFRAMQERSSADAERFENVLMQGVLSLDPDKGPGMADVARPQLAEIEASLNTTPRPLAKQAKRREEVGEQYRKWGQLDRAMLNLRQALELYERLHRGPHEDVARCLRNLGGLYFELWQLDEAETFCRRSLEMRRAVHPERDASEIVDSMNYLAQVLGRMRRFDEAERLGLEALEMTQKRFGDRSSETARYQNNLATLRYQRGDYSGAEALYREALEVFRASLGGKSHRYVARSLRNIAGCMVEQGRTQGVEELLVEARKLAAEFLGEDSPDVASAVHDLARLKLRLGQTMQAERLCREALVMRENRRGTAHAETVSSRLLLGRILTEAGEAYEGEALIRGVLDARRNARPVLALDVAEAETALGEALLAQDRADDAVTSYSAALAVLARDLGAEHARTARCVEGLTRALKASGREVTPELISRLMGRD